MDCEQAQSLLTAQLHGEIQPGEQPLLEAHLNECIACRSSVEAGRLLDADLRRAFAPRRRAAAAVVDRVVAQLAQLPDPPIHRGRRWTPWFLMLASAAAGFLLAVMVFRPWQKQVEPTRKPEEGQTTTPAVQLALATGPVEALVPGASAWKPLALQDRLAAGSRIRTGPRTRCEFQTRDGCEIRVNHNTELLFGGERQLELAGGRILARVVKGQVPFAVKVPEATITALGTQFDVRCEPAAATVLTVLEGSTSVQGKGVSAVVETGEEATIVRGQIAAKRPVDDLLRATSWVNELLTLKGRDNRELAQRVDDLLAQIGMTKEAFLTEEEIRALGYHCVLPLSRFVQSDRSRAPDQERKRVDAMRILSDLAQPWSIPDLIGLLRDKDPEVRFYAAKGLLRLTGLSQDCELTSWHKPAWNASCQNGYQRWQAWWQKNKNRYPAAP